MSAAALAHAGPNHDSDPAEAVTLSRQSAIPDSSRPSAVVAFMLAKPGLMAFSKPMSKNHPISTIAPTSISVMPVTECNRCPLRTWFDETLAGVNDSVVNIR